MSIRKFFYLCILTSEKIPSICNVLSHEPPQRRFVVLMCSLIGAAVQKDGNERNPKYLRCSSHNAICTKEVKSEEDPKYFIRPRPNSVYTDAGVRITIDIDDTGYSFLSSLFSVTWIFGCQYNNSNMPDVRASAVTVSESLCVCPLMAGRGSCPRSNQRIAGSHHQAAIRRSSQIRQPTAVPAAPATESRHSCADPA